VANAEAMAASDYSRAITAAIINLTCGELQINGVFFSLFTDVASFIFCGSIPVFKKIMMITQFLYKRRLQKIKIIF
jgi:hypothetical protein